MDKLNQINFLNATNRPIQKLNGTISFDNDVEKTGFKDMFANMINEMNEITSKPEQVTKDVMLGKADIHDAMSAIAQSELTVQAATTITGKILQTYEKIMQIQI